MEILNNVNNNVNDNVHNVIIIGSGCAGLTAAIYTARANLSPLVIGGYSLGGQLMTTTSIENFPGFPQGIQGPALMEQMMEQACHFGAKILQEQVVQIDYSQSPYSVYTEEQEIKCHSIIIATGADAKWLGLPEEDKYKNNGISTCAVCDGPLPVFRNETLVVVGGGDTACEEALFLTSFAKEVIMLVRGSSMRASFIMQQAVEKNEKITLLYHTKMIQYLGETELEKIIIETNGNQREIETKGVFIAIGHTPNTHFLKSGIHPRIHQGIHQNENGYITDCLQEGIFIAGDCSDFEYRQAITACGFGCMAGLKCIRWLQEKCII